MNKEPPEELAKIHCLMALFSEKTGEDKNIASNIRSAIDYHLTGSLEETAPLESFVEEALRLFKEETKESAPFDIACIDLRGRSYDPLWLNTEFVSAFKKLCGYKNALLVVRGLREAISPNKKYWTKKLQEEHNVAISHIDKLALKWKAESTELMILYI